MRPHGVPEVICHVLLCETDAGLALVDSGLGTVDFAHPERMGPARFMLRPECDDANTALARIEALGYVAADIAHIVLTHMDFDHIGGIADFPGATIHTTAIEYDTAAAHPSLYSQQRYQAAQWSHGPTVELHRGQGEEWRYGLTGHEVLPGMTMIPMPGHTRGHAAIAVDGGERGVLIHAGDAVFDASSITSTSPSGATLAKRRSVRAFEQAMAVDRKAVRVNHLTLARLQREAHVTVIPAHDKRIFDALVG